MERETGVLRKVEDGIRLVPVLVEEVGNRLPAQLRKLARRSVVDYEAIRDTLLGVDHRPGSATALDALTRTLVLRLEDAGAVVDACVEASPGLAPLPFEAALTPKDRTPVLLPGVRTRARPRTRMPPKGCLLAVSTGSQTATWSHMAVRAVYRVNGTVAADKGGDRKLRGVTTMEH